MKWQWIKSSRGDDELCKKAQMVQRLLNLWQIEGLKKKQLLIPDYQGAKQSEIEVFSEILERIDLLLTIHLFLRTLYPVNPEHCYNWVHCRNRFLDNQKPLDIMISSVAGIEKIVNLLRHFIYK